MGRKTIKNEKTEPLLLDLDLFNTKSKEFVLEVENSLDENKLYNPRRRRKISGSYTPQTPDDYISKEGIKRNQEVYIKVSHYNIHTWRGLGADELLGLLVYTSEYIEYWCDGEYIPYWQVGIEKNERPIVSIPEAAIVKKLSKKDLDLLKLMPTIPRSVIQDIEIQGIEEVEELD